MKNLSENEYFQENIDMMNLRYCLMSSKFEEDVFERSVMELPVFVYIIAFAVIGIAVGWAIARNVKEKKNKNLKK